MTTYTFKVTSKLMAMVMLLQSVQCAYAAKWSDSGVYSISWFDKNQTDFYISSASELAGMAYLVNNNFTSFSGKTIHLSSDINLQGKEWIPIGSNNTVFQGSFDGNGFTISNVSITSPNDYYCGFWRTVKDSKVCNLNLETTIVVNESYIGAIAASASNTTFENINVECDVSYSKTDVSTNTGSTFKNYVGGVVGYSSDCEYHDVKSKTNVQFSFGASSGSSCYGKIELYLGGIVGYGDCNVYEKCQTINDFDVTIYGYEASSSYTSSGASSIVCGGIVGSDKDSKTKIVSCLVNTQNFKGYHYKGNYDTKAFTYGGIVGNIYGTLQNCVAITRSYSITGHSYSWVASWYHTNSTFGGITGGFPTTFGGCYSNNDVVKTKTKVGTDSEGKHGSTSCSEAQINSQSFVDEINIYSQLMFGINTWGLDDEGKLTLIDETTNVIENIKTDRRNTIVGYYDLQGRKLNSTTKGVNIVRYSDGSSRKVYVK